VVGLAASQAGASVGVVVGGELIQFAAPPIVRSPSGDLLISRALIERIWEPVEGQPEAGRLGDRLYRFLPQGDLSRGGRSIARRQRLAALPKTDFYSAASLRVEGLDIFFDPRLAGYRVVGTLRRITLGEDGSVTLVAVGPLAMRKIPSTSARKLTIELPGIRPAPELFTPPRTASGIALSLSYRAEDYTTVLTFDLPADRNVHFLRSSGGRVAAIDLSEHLELAGVEASYAGSAIFTLILGSNPDYRVFRLTDPPRLVFDFPGVRIAGPTRRERLSLESVREVRVGQFQEDPPIARLVFETAYPLRYRVIKNSGGVFRVQLIDPAKARSEGLIVLDAGHGGTDTGAIGTRGTEEKEINLAIARLTQKDLEEMGYQVVQTREGDYFLSLQERAELANKLAPVAFVSIHSNSIPNPETQGIMTFHHPTAGEARKLARYIQSSLIEVTRAVDKGVRTADFYVLRETLVPAVLVETGFLTNPEEESRLRDPSYQALIAQGIARGIAAWLREVEFEDAPLLETLSLP